MSRALVVTGGLGFIGSAFVRRVSHTFDRVLNLDAHTYAADPKRIPNELKVETTRVDIASDGFEDALQGVDADVIVHFAAETHVTRSETDEGLFSRTNVEGTRRVLEAARNLGPKVFIHVSTDEVYGPALDHPFEEDEKGPGPGAATSAYARSKAEADDIARSFASDLNVIVVRPTNCFGPWQHPEKAIARWATRALAGKPLPVWGDGGYVRDWMFVDDVSSAIELLIENPPESGGVYNIGPEGEPISNLEIARLVASAAGVDPETVYLTAYDRPLHDRRYSVDSTKIRQLGWTPQVGVREGIKATVAWYDGNRSWWEQLVDEAEAIYDDEARVR